MRVKLCFLVKVRKAMGRSVAGGRAIGRIEDLIGGSIGLCKPMGCTGVPKPGEDEGMIFGCIGVGPLRNLNVLRDTASSLSTIMINPLLPLCDVQLKRSA